MLLLLKRLQPGAARQIMCLTLHTFCLQAHHERAAEEKKENVKFV